MRYIIFIALTFISMQSRAYWLDTGGSVTGITTYANTETILVTISSNGTDVQACSNKNVFAISKDMSAEGRARMYSMLLAAQASGRNVVVSYNNAGGCEPWGAEQNVYRKIVRLR